jgi:hypothetical protein
MTTVFLNVGTKNLITPADIVGKIAGVTRLPADIVGAVDIHPRHTLVDVADKAANLVVQKLAGIRVKGVALEPALRLAGEPFGEGFDVGGADAEQPGAGVGVEAAGRQSQYGLRRTMVRPAAELLSRRQASEVKRCAGCDIRRGIHENHEVVAGDEVGVFDRELVVALDRDPGQFEGREAFRQGRAETVVTAPGIAKADHQYARHGGTRGRSGRSRRPALAVTRIEDHHWAAQSKARCLAATRHPAGS